MDYTLNSTRAYHMNRLNTLGWELTVCNALYPEGTPLRRLLSRDDSYGHLLYDYLGRFIAMNKIRRVVEIGGGYGYLMKDFLDRNGLIEPLMIDISPQLLGKQKETLACHPVSFMEADFLDVDPASLRGFDLAVMNENLGDFPTLVSLDHQMFESTYGVDDPVIGKVRDLFTAYNLERPKGERFNFNIGAIEALEKLCASDIPKIFLSEHSCEASVPAAKGRFICMKPSGDPERISLMGHDEYSIRFSYLEKIALAYGYKSLRGPFADFLRFEITDRLKNALLSRGRWSDDNEAICHFVEDLYKYEYLLLAKEA